MSWVKNTLTSSLGQKLLMSISGLSLVIFLVVHLAGNFSLLLNNGSAFNEYAHFMKANKLIVASEFGLFGMFFLHIIQGIMIAKKNAGARTQKYAVPHKNEKVSWKSKYMIHMGIVILAFFVLHLVDFFSFKYFREASLEAMDFSNLAYLKHQSWMVPFEGEMIPNLHAKVHEVYVNSYIHWIVYPISMLVIGFHLSHGFQSAFQTLGINHKKYTPAIKIVGNIYAVVVPLAFALIPLFIKFGLTFG